MVGPSVGTEGGLEEVAGGGMKALVALGRRPVGAAWSWL